MKKKIFILLMVVTTILVTACGKDISFDMKKASKTIENKLKSMKEISKTTLEDVYDLDTSKMNDFTFKENEDGDFYAIIKTDSLNEVKNNMKNYFEKVKQFNQSYSPERLKLLNNRIEKEVDDYLIYIIAKDANKIYDKIVEGL